MTERTYIPSVKRVPCLMHDIPVNFPISGTFTLAGPLQNESFYIFRRITEKQSDFVWKASHHLVQTDSGSQPPKTCCLTADRISVISEQSAGPGLTKIVAQSVRAVQIKQCPPIVVLQRDQTKISSGKSPVVFSDLTAHILFS